MATKLYVGNLSYETSDGDLRDWFASAGEVVSASVINDKYSGRSKGFGFVEMASQDQADKAIQELNGKSFGSRTITVQEARPQENRASSGQRSYGGGGDGYGGGRSGGGSRRW